MPIQLIITLNDDGQIGVNAPLQDKVLCYGLLEVARDAIQKYHEQQPKKSAIVTVPPGTVVPKSHQ
jgi:hypothetical protein